MGHPLIPLYTETPCNPKALPSCQELCGPLPTALPHMSLSLHIRAAEYPDILPGQSPITPLLRVLCTL